MLGLKIAITGAVMVLIASICGQSIGKKVPAAWIAIPLIVTFFGGILAIIGGFLYWVWA